jgi:hypothetical protein
MDIAKILEKHNLFQSQDYITAKQSSLTRFFIAEQKYQVNIKKTLQLNNRPF